MWNAWTLWVGTASTMHCADHIQNGAGWLPELYEVKAPSPFVWNQSRNSQTVMRNLQPKGSKQPRVSDVYYIYTLE